MFSDRHCHRWKCSETFFLLPIRLASSTLILPIQGTVTKRIKTSHWDRHDRTSYLQLTTHPQSSSLNASEALLSPHSNKWTVITLFMLHIVEIHHSFSSYSEVFRDYQRVLDGWGCCYSSNSVTLETWTPQKSTHTVLFRQFIKRCHNLFW